MIDPVLKAAKHSSDAAILIIKALGKLEEASMALVLVRSQHNDGTYKSTQDFLSAGTALVVEMRRVWERKGYSI